MRSHCEKNFKQFKLKETKEKKVVLEFSREIYISTSIIYLFIHLFSI